MAAIAELRRRRAPETEAAGDIAPDEILASRIDSLEAAIRRIEGAMAAQGARLRELSRPGADRLSRALAGMTTVLAGAALAAVLMQ
jgi:hypothetical protein